MTFAQDTMFMRMSKSDVKATGWLVPESENKFEVKQGTVVKFQLTLSHDGEEYPLRQKDFIEASFIHKEKEYSFPIKLERISQVDFLKNKIKQYKKRIETLNSMDLEKANGYVTRFKIKDADTKEKYIAYLQEEITKKEKTLPQAEEFDKSKMVKPGARLTFFGSGFLPEQANKDHEETKTPDGTQIVKQSVIMLKIFNEEEKRLSLPVKVNFY